jgi:DNA-binding response OmpR family regulator
MDDAVDVVLLDRRMPDMSGDEVLAAIREEGYDCKVAMVTAVDPDVDIVEMPFDAYLTKPVQKTDLVDVIDRLDVVARQASVSQELFAVTEKRATLESEFNRSRLARSEEYTDLVERHESLSAEARETIQGMDHEGFEASFRDLGDGLDGSGND